LEIEMSRLTEYSSKYSSKSCLALLFACLAGFVTFAQPAAAQAPTTAQRDAIREACRSDYEAHCASVPTGGKPALMCLQKNMASLSSACQKAVKAVGGSSSAPAAAPAPATAAAPAAAPQTGAAPQATQTAPPPGAAASGAKAKPSTVGAAMAPIPRAVTPRQEIRLVRSACGNDFRTYCSGMQPGGGRVVECLRANAASLSPTCQGALMDLRQAR
jgi:hypothetical protein